MPVCLGSSWAAVGVAEIVFKKIYDFSPIVGPSQNSIKGLVVFVPIVLFLLSVFLLLFPYVFPIVVFYCFSYRCFLRLVEKSLPVNLRWPESQSSAPGPKRTDNPKTNRKFTGKLISINSFDVSH